MLLYGEVESVLRSGLCLYWTKKISDVPMSSSASLKLYHMCGYGGWLGGGIRGIRG